MIFVYTHIDSDGEHVHELNSNYIGGAIQEVEKKFDVVTSIDWKVDGEEAHSVSQVEKSDGVYQEFHVIEGVIKPAQMIRKGSCNELEDLAVELNKGVEFHFDNDGNDCEVEGAVFVIKKVEGSVGYQIIDSTIGFEPMRESWDAGAIGAAYWEAMTSKDMVETREQLYQFMERMSLCLD